MLSYLLSLAPLSVTAKAKSDTIKLQFIPYLISAFDQRTRSKVTFPVTLIITVDNLKRAEYVCAMAPKIRDAVFLKLYGYQIKKGTDRKLALTYLADDLKPKITKALNWKIVERVELAPGTPEVPKSAISKFAKKGCMKVEEPRQTKENSSAK